MVWVGSWTGSLVGSWVGPVLVLGCGAVGTGVGAGCIPSGGACAPSAAWPSVWASPSLPTDLRVLGSPPFGLSASSSTFGRSSSAMSSGPYTKLLFRVASASACAWEPCCCHASGSGCRASSSCSLFGSNHILQRN